MLTLRLLALLLSEVEGGGVVIDGAERIVLLCGVNLGTKLFEVEVGGAY